MSETAHSGFSPATVGPGAGNGMTKNERRNWFMGLLIAFVLGFLLAWYLLGHQIQRLGCPRPSDQGPPLSMAGSGSGHGAPGRGSPQKLGSPGEGTADHNGNSRTTVAEGGGGAQGRGGGGDGNLKGGEQWQAHGKDQSFDGKSGPSDKSPVGGGDADGEAKDGTGGEGTKSPPQEARTGRPPDGTGPLYKESGGAADTGKPGAAGSSVSGVASNIVVAPDLRYDTSELPRYPNAVTQMESGTALPKGAPAADPNMSVSAILTSDDPQTVAAWYHEQLPKNWTEVNLGGLTIFWPPDRKADPRTVWIVLDDKTSKTAALLWKPKQKPAP